MKEETKYIVSATDEDGDSLMATFESHSEAMESAQRRGFPEFELAKVTMQTTKYVKRNEYIKA